MSLDEPPRPAPVRLLPERRRLDRRRHRRRRHLPAEGLRLRRPAHLARRQPRIGKVVTGLVVSTNGAVGGGERNNAPVGPATSSPSGAKAKWYTYDAALPRTGGVDRGHVMRWACVADKPPTNRATTPPSGTGEDPPPKAEDGDLVARFASRRSASASAPSSTPPPGRRRRPIQDDDPF